MRRASLLLLLALSSSSFGFELKRDSTGEVVRWKQKVHFVLDQRAPALLGDSQAVFAVQRAIDAVATSTPGLKVSVQTGAISGAGYDRSGGKNANEIVVPEEWAYDANTIAVTLVTVDAGTHQILDADIAFNTVYRKFKVLETSGESSSEYDDIQNTLTHELGHAVGLAHNAAEPKAVMYPGARKGEVNKRVLLQDDKDGLIALYPSAALADATDDETGPQVGCAAGAGLSSGWLALFLLPLMLRRQLRRQPLRLQSARRQERQADSHHPRRRSARWQSFRRSLGTAALIVAAAAPALAEASEPTRNPASVADSAMVATVQVTGAHTRDPGDSKMLFTEVEVSIVRCLKGACPSRMMLVVPGGRVGNIEQYVEGAPVPTAGASLGLTVRSNANLSAPSLKELSIYRLGELRDFTAFAEGLQRAGLSVTLPLPLLNATQR